MCLVVFIEFVILVNTAFCTKSIWGKISVKKSKLSKISCLGKHVAKAQNRWLGCRKTSWQGLIPANINGLLCPLWSKRAMLHCVQWKTKHRGSPEGWCFQSLSSFFLYTFLPELLRTPAQCRRTRESRLLLFFSFLSFLPPPPPHHSNLHPESRRQLEIAQTCSPSQSRGLLASSAGRLPRPHPLIRRDRQGGSRGLRGTRSVCGCISSKVLHSDVVQLFHKEVNMRTVTTSQISSDTALPTIQPSF